MREKGKQQRSSEERQSEEAPPTKSTKNPAAIDEDGFAAPTKSTKNPAAIDEDGFARRAGEIIAQAARHVNDANRHPRKRK
jgi:hypothetical protein